MSVVRGIAQMRIQVSNDLDDGMGHRVPFFAVFDLHAFLYHFLNVPSVFRNDEPGAGRIVLHSSC